jgi:predicted aldo/keto reductase-like oxidoreductase
MPAVITRRFGRTELQIPVFSCGGMRYQQSWSRGAKVTAASQENLHATIDRALALGIDHIETARGYGTSEAQLGPVLARHPRASFKLQTKLRPIDDAALFERQMEESFRCLGVDHLDLFAFHGVNTPACLDRIFRPGGCLEVAHSWRRAGRIRHIGLSTHAPTAMILQAVQTGAFDYINLHYYYIFPDNRPVLDAAAQQDMGVFIISPTDKGGRLQTPPAKLRALTAPLSPMVFNDLWCLAHPQIHTLSIGAARPSDFDEHLRALPLLDDPQAHLQPIVQRLQTAYADALGPAYARDWQRGLLPHQDLPGGINVRQILWLDNLARAFDLVDFAQERYATMAPNDHWVPGAKAIAVDDDALIAALPDSPFRAELPQRLRAAHQRLHNPHAEPQP